METLQLILLSIVQGLTEFLPVSSSAHLILLSEIINQDDQGIVFDVGVHLGTLLAAVIYFRKEIQEILFNLSSKKLIDQENRLFFNLLVALPKSVVLTFGLTELITLLIKNFQELIFQACINFLI